MAGNIKGITIEFRGDTTQLDKALREIEKESKGIDKELKDVNKALKFNPTSVDLWKQKQTLLKDKITETSDKLKVLKDAQKKLDAKQVDKNSKEYRTLQREIITTESKLKHFKTELKTLGSAKLQALGAQFKQIGSKMMGVGRSLSMYVTAPLVGVGAASLRAGADFDTAMSQVAATSGKTVNEIDELREFAKKMGSETSFSATQAAEGLNFMALAGYDAETSMKMLPTVLDLAAAGAMELGAASDMVTDAQSALGLSLDDTTKMVDEMAKTSSKSNTSVSQLGEAILKIGPTAKNLKGGTKELNQVLGLLADNGIKGAEAGTHLRNIMLALNPQTDKAAQAWDKLGVSAYDADGNLRPMEETFGDLSKAMEGMSSQERTEMLSNMFNKTDLASVNALLDTSANRWTELGLAIDDSVGSAGQMAETQLDNMQGSLTLLKSALEGAGIAISDVLAPYIKKLAEWVQGVVSAFNDLDPNIQRVIVIIGAIVAAIGPLLIIGGMIANAIGTILPLLSGTLGPIIAIVGAIGALVAALVFAYNNSVTFRDAVNELITVFVDNFKPIIDLVIDGFKVLIKEVIQTVMVVASQLAPVIQTLMPIIKVVAGLLSGALKRGFTLIIGVVRSVLAIIRSLAIMFNSTFQAVVSIALSAVAKIKAVFAKVRDAIVGPFEKARDAVKGIIDKIKGFFNFTAKSPKIPLPHFAIKPSGWKIGDLLEGKIPSLSIKWYAKGGIFNSPTLAGIGEAGPEAVVPLDKFWRKLEQMQGGDVIVNVYGSDNMSVNELALAVEQRIIEMEKRRKMAWQ